MKVHRGVTLPIRGKSKSYSKLYYINISLEFYPISETVEPEEGHSVGDLKQNKNVLYFSYRINTYILFKEAIFFGSNIIFSLRPCPI